jgi:flotillin
MLLYKIAEANEALIITGARAHSGQQGDIGGPEGGGFKIVVGKGAWVIPFFQKARRLGLQAHKTDINVECVTTQGIQVQVRGVVVYKVGDDFGSIANAARRFLESEDEMDGNVHNVFAGHMRSIVGSMTVENIIRNRDELAKQTRESSATEMQKLGLVIDSLQIQELDERNGYIDNLAKPERAKVESAARIAAASRDQEATEKEQEAQAHMARARSESEVQQAELRAAAQTAQQKADQAGPLAAAAARMAVVEQETKVSQLEAARREQELQVEVVKPAQAERDATIAKAEADRQRVVLAAQAKAEATKVEAAADAEAARIKGEAEGEAIKARLTAEAKGLEARAAALASNQEAVIAQQVAEHLPAIVGEAAKAFGSIGQLTVLNGADGMTDVFSQAVALGVGVLPMVQAALKNGADNGKTEEKLNVERTEVH